MPPSSGKAQLFTKRNYGGEVMTLEEGTFRLGASTEAAGNGTISSLKIAPGYAVTVYSGNNFQGASAIFTQIPPMSAISSTTLSLRSRSPPPPPPRRPPTGLMKGGPPTGSKDDSRWFPHSSAHPLIGHRTYKRRRIEPVTSSV